MLSILRWICLIFIVAPVVAEDVPFVFDKNYKTTTNYTSDEIKNLSEAALVGEPVQSSLTDDEILEISTTGGGGSAGGKRKWLLGDLKKIFDLRVEPDNDYVHHVARVLAAKYPGDRTIGQICAIYEYLKSGDSSKNGWSYVGEARGEDIYSYANDTLKVGEEAGCAGAGDCDDFAILMASLIESVGGTTRVVFGYNNSTAEGHAYTEVFLGKLDDKDDRAEDIIKWLKQNYGADEIYTHVDTVTKDVWLNLDWSADHPGGPLFLGDKHVILLIRADVPKAPLKSSEGSPAGPIMSSRTARKPSEPALSEEEMKVGEMFSQIENESGSWSSSTSGMSMSSSISGTGVW